MLSHLEDSNVLLYADRLSKNYKIAAKALDNVSLAIRKGEVHAVLGENGAGKSTLAKIIAGIITSNEGDLFLLGTKVKISNPNVARILGISMVHQEPMVVKSLPIWANIFLGHEEKNNVGILDKEKMRMLSKNVLIDMGIDIDPNTLVSSLSPAEIQLVAIAKAIIGNVKILILDEPTASLTHNETERLYTIIRMLTSKEVGILYISHRMKEIFEITDRITVLRDGKLIDCIDTKSTNEDALIQLMTGKNMKTKKTTPIRVKTEETILYCDHLGNGDLFSDITFEVKSGEIIGIGGLVGSGKEQLNRVIFGMEPLIEGKIFIEGGEVNRPTPKTMIEKGVMYCPAERQEGLIYDQSVLDNLLLPSLKLYSNSLGLKKKNKLINQVNSCIQRLDIKPPVYQNPVKTYSGGNQQKIMLGRCLTRPLKLLLLDEPTRGVDVGAREYIYEFIRKLANNGAGILVVSSDINELFNLPIKIMVMFTGSISTMYKPAELEEEDFLNLCFKGDIQKGGYLQ